MKTIARAAFPGHETGMTETAEPPVRVGIIPVTPLEQNCSLVWCTKTMKGALVDPGGDLDKLKAAGKFDGATEIITIDGVRVEYADGFGLARPSNTTPVVVLRFEADNATALERIQAGFRQAISAVWPGIELPF